PRVDFDKTETVGSTRWMRLETLSYHVPPEEKEGGGGDDGTNRKWDRAVRTTKQSENSIDAVVILAILKNDPTNPSKDEIVCVKQFRPPVDAYTIELPAGLIDPDEDPAVAAEREFHEETGYIGKVVTVLPASYLSPGLTNESACIVKLEVDMTLERNIQIHNDRIENLMLEGCEKDRGLEKLLLPRIGLLGALHDLQEKEGVKVFAALYSLALGMSVGEEASMAAAAAAGSQHESSSCASPDFPLVTIELDDANNPTAATSNAVTSALRDTGFLMIKTPLLPLELQQRALAAASQFLESTSSPMVVTHPSDPKVYAMLQGIDSFGNDDDSIDPPIINDLKEYYHALHKTKFMLLHCIAVGLGMMDDPNFFVNLHDENNDAVRLLKYPPGNEHTANRCKEHSDYGTLTLLLNDGVGGLEAFVNNEEWRPIPYVEGSIVVNIGSILSEWTRQELKATLHRVAGPASVGSITPRDVLLKAVAVSRISIAYFADPNGDVSTALVRGKTKNEGGEENNGDEMSVSDYIRWRSGGEGRGRSGVAFTSTEESRLGILEDLLEKMPY
ncbi:hypothetical protein ACHAXR_004405, partial [Thalassiosira sp. AJA248-18]